MACSRAWKRAMRRRDFIAGTVASTAAWPLATNAQQRAMPVIGFLSTLSPSNMAANVQRSAFIHTGLTRARGSMFTHFTPADLVAILNIPRLQTLPNSFKILREY